jgi:predicted Rossmann fold flavoprotein
MDMEKETQYDLIVVGGGPSGMICAGRAAARGARVLLLEKNPVLGVKLALTGGGRCNLTNAIGSIRELVSRYGDGGKALFPAFSRFGPDDAIAFFKTLGLETHIEAEGRVFPASNDARDVIRVLAEYMKSGQVTVVLNSTVQKIGVYDNHVRVVASTGEYRAGSLAVATGGLAYPETGSNGDGFVWLAKLGHKIVTPDTSLVPLCVNEPRMAELAGLSFQDIRASIVANHKKTDSKTGKMVFTHFGLSGPLILNMSRKVGDTLKKGEVSISFDFIPKQGQAEADTELLRIFGANQNKKIKNVASLFLPPKISDIALERLAIDPEKFVNLVSRTERLALVKIAKDMRFSVSKLMGLSHAIVSSGGVDPSEVDFRTMRSKIKTNLYILGDALNFNRPSGGFSLQICWTTGYLAGEAVVLKGA